MHTRTIRISDRLRRMQIVETTYRLLEVGDEVVPVLLLLETSERHLRTGDVLHAG